MHPMRSTAYSYGINNNTIRVAR